MQLINIFIIEKISVRYSNFVSAKLKKIL